MPEIIAQVTSTEYDCHSFLFLEKTQSLLLIKLQNQESAVVLSLSNILLFFYTHYVLSMATCSWNLFLGKQRII